MRRRFSSLAQPCPRLTHTLQRASDLLGRLTSLTYPDGEVARSTYDPQGGLKTLTLQSPVSGLPGPPPTQAGAGLSLVSDVRYTAAGQLEQLRYGNGVTTAYAYHDLTLRLKTLTTTHPTHGTLQEFAYAFDAAGNVTAITDYAHSGSSQTFTYDPLNRLIRAQGSYGDLRYGYDALGNLLEKENRTLLYGAGPAGPHAVTSTSDGLTLSYDANGNVTEKRPASCPATGACPAVQTFKYDAENRLVEVTSPKRQTVTLSLKPGWNLISLPITPDNAAISAIFPSFATDLAQISRRTSAGAWEHHVGIAKFDQFTTLEAGVAYEVYAKRAVSVTLSGTVPATTARSLSAGWHLLPALVEGPTSPAQAFAGLALGQVLGYDTGSRSLTSATQVQPGQSYWVQVTTASTWTPPVSGSLTTRFVYDGDGGKVKRIDGGKTTVLLGELVEITPTETTKYLFAGSQRIAAKTSKGELRFYHGDHLGSTNVVTDATGQVVERTEYTPFGSVASASNLEPRTLNGFGFTGQRQDESHGLILFPARAYDPDLGRFLQPDPFVQDPSDPQTLNRYTYVRNNPVNLVDQTGYGWFRKVLAAVFAIVATALMPEGAGVWWNLAAAVAGAVIGDQVGAAIERSSSRSPAGSAPPPAAPPMPNVPVGARAASFVSGFVPFLGEAQDAAGAFLGIDLITGEEVSPGFRVLSGVTLLIPLAGAVSIRQIPRLLNQVVPAEDIVQVFRVEGLSNARIAIDAAGDVSISDATKTLFLNFGQPGRAAAFLQQRIKQGLPGATIKSFKVQRGFLDHLRRTAVRETEARLFPHNPLLVDVTKALDQFGLRSPQIKDLLKNIIRGSGKIVR